MSGHFFAFKNREKTSESKKNSLRENISSRKLSLINKNSVSNEHLISINNQISVEELKNIRYKIKLRQKKEALIYGLSFIIIITVLILLGLKYNVF